MFKLLFCQIDCVNRRLEKVYSDVSPMLYALSQEITCEIDASYLGLIRENEKHTSLDKKVIHQWLWPCQPSFTFIITFYPWRKRIPSMKFLKNKKILSKDKKILSMVKNFSSSNFIHQNHLYLQCDM